MQKMAEITRKKAKIAICQIPLCKDKITNIKEAEKQFLEAVGKGADLIVTGETFVCPYGKQFFPDAAENEFLEPSKAVALTFLKDFAKQHHVYIIGGSIPEIEGEKLYNTSYVFDRNGNYLAKHRKLHMFDINFKGKVYKESEIFNPGNKITVFDTDFCRIGLGICFDIRFPELALAMSQMGAEMLVYPAAFAPTTGPVHWELLGRSRALDNQAYVVLASTARPVHDLSLYQTYAHSMFIDPCGNVISKLDIEPGVIMTEFDPEIVNQFRGEIPIITAKRNELYRVEVSK